MPDSEGSTVLFHRQRAMHTNGAMMSFQSIPFIPTKYLGDILEKVLARMSHETTLQPFSSHFLTRTGVGSIFEQNMHRHSRMCSSGTALRNSNASHHMLMHPPTHLLPGVDGVLGDTTGNLFALQATIADDHECPD
ncbi:hypothetical protein GG344DRAFT_77597 [Lentinula edodes]|nr:hypothetical protein GG344DRAFT_77597 [Lentinula edodes]